jgi:hypothetical protein
MHTSPATVIRLRKGRFDARARELGLASNTACAEYMGIDQSTVSRIRNGEVMPGERFIAACLKSGFARSFEALFELGEAS